MSDNRSKEGSSGLAHGGAPTPGLLGPDPAPLRILVVEPHRQTADAIAECLTGDGYHVDAVRTVAEGEPRALTESYCAAILNATLPDGNGTELCRNLRRWGVKTPVLLLTDSSGGIAEMPLFGGGANDHMRLPLNTEELLVRVRALALPSVRSKETKLRFADTEMDLLERGFHRRGRCISLTAREFDLMEFLMRNPNRALDRAAIAKGAWNLDDGDKGNAVEVYMSILRSKVDKPFDTKLIHAVNDEEYLFGEGNPDGVTHQPGAPKHDQPEAHPEMSTACLKASAWPRKRLFPWRARKSVPQVSPELLAAPA
jgi:DNA-binding response OmpR family regulator